MSSSTPSGDPRIAGVAYPSLYVRDFEEVIDFWTRVVGPPAHREESLAGFPLGDSFLTVFRDGLGTHPGSDPRNTEFAIRVAEAAHVDELMEAFLEAGSTLEMAARDTWMYRDMRFGCVNTPHGVRVDVYCPLPADALVEGGPAEP
jgi:catechol 2,3-dioxygenase-like lactoylglutathione lyase family enzyme